jgi:hypothetical protein
MSNEFPKRKLRKQFHLQEHQGGEMTQALYAHMNKKKKKHQKDVIT